LKKKPQGPTFGEALAARNLVDQCTEVTRMIIARAEASVAEEARRTLRVISCHGCTAAKGCCTLTTLIYLYEAVPIAARLRREGRDTPALRKQLLASAERMESLPPREYNQPCVFLGGDERCTIYDTRPGDCGVTYVSSSPALCSIRGSDVVKFRDPTGDASEGAQMMFEQELGLTLPDTLAMGALPRMVLLCLHAWDRADYAEYLGKWVPVAATRVLGAISGQRGRT
jgi:Fe-S-cluster containining protein